MKAVILAAGLGTRLSEDTATAGSPRDKVELENRWQSGTAPWKVW